MPDEGPEVVCAAFDLTSNAWVRVLGEDGLEEELSLREVFAQAEGLRCVVGDLPTQDFALVRLLLAILHDALDGPADAEDWRQLWEDKDSFGPVASYLDKHRGSFDLLHPSAPFFQAAGLRAVSGEVSSLDRVVADVPNGDRFFTMRAAGASRLGFAEAARWLVHVHAFDSSGIKTGAEGDPRVKGGRGYPQGVAWAGNLGGVLVEGSTLRETLLLNLVAADTGNLRIASQDRPAWRGARLGPAETGELELARRPFGPRDLYTWQSRRVRLHHDAEGVYGVVLSYGDRLHARNKHRHEPMTAWRRSPVQEKKLGLPEVYLPREHDPARSAWRGLGALVAGRTPGAEQRQEAAQYVRPRILDWIARLVEEECLPPAFLIRARLTGAIYGTQQSVIDEVVDDSVTMPVVLLHAADPRLGQTAVDAVEDADKAVKALGELAETLAQAAGKDPEPHRAGARDRGYAELDAPFRRWLRDFTPDSDPVERRRTWQRSAHRAISRLGTQMVADAGEGAWQGRVIDTKRGEMWLSSASAELWFRRNLREVLPLSADEPAAVQSPRLAPSETVAESV